MPPHAATLHDGRRVEVRPATPADAHAVAAFYERLPTDDRHRRFFTGGLPPPSWIEDWVRQNDTGGVVLVAVVTDPATGTSEIVGDAGCGVQRGGSAELGIAVDPAWRGWVGPFLLDALVDAARARDIPALEAVVLSDNRAMLRLLASRGEAMLPNGDLCTVRVVIPTDGRAPVWPPWMERPRLLVEVRGGRWRAAREAADAGLHVICCPRLPRHCPMLAGRRCPLVSDADVVVCVAHDGDADAATLLDAHRALDPDRPVLVDDGRVSVAAVVAAASVAAGSPTA